jgi:hypothetical protein
MSRARVPWWGLAIAASTLGYMAFMAYADVFGPGAVGAAMRFREGRILVVEVVDDYPVAVLAARPLPIGVNPGRSSNALDSFYAGALSADPKLGPASARALADALGAVLPG